MIAIIDYKAGNVASLVAALQRLGQDCIITNDSAVIRAADKVIFPGQGRATPAMAELNRTGLNQMISTLTQPFLGICLGMQLLLEHSEEDDTPGLGVIPGKVVRFQTNEPVPQVGWNNGYYFVHSYYVDTAPQYTLFRHRYGGVWFASMIAKANFFGVQFHPEKSGAAGQQLLKQFCETGRIQPTHVIPAIDLLNGKCVRLQQGNYQRVTEYSADPIGTALQFQNQGSVWLHVVDLDGAKIGKPMNQSTIFELVNKTNLRIQVGGGIRTVETARMYLDAGVDRIILGTAAIQQPQIITDLINRYGTEKVAVSLDVKKSQVMMGGWTIGTAVSVVEVLQQFKKNNLQYIITTDISKDGMLAGLNLDLAKTIQEDGFQVIVSGGISSQADVDLVKSGGFAGMIIGKALYEDKITLQPFGFRKRIIACLDIAHGRVVKGTHFTDLKDQGDPVGLARRYQDQGADEIVFLDIMATLENRATLYAVVRQVAETLMIPFCVGGGVRSVDDIRELLLAGADKVSIGSAAVTNPSFIKQASEQFGAQGIVVSIDPKWNGSFWEVYISGGNEATGINAIEFAEQMQQAGAGELLINSLDRDGTRQGYDLTLLCAISSAVNIPVIASSGVGTVQHIKDVFDQTNVSAALVAGVLHSGELTINRIKQQL